MKPELNKVFLIYAPPGISFSGIVISPDLPFLFRGLFLAGELPLLSTSSLAL